MKKINLLTLFLIGIASFCQAQDLITKKTGEDIQAKITEVNQTEIKYKRFDNLDGPVFTLSKADILMIRYENGTKDIYSEQTSRNSQNYTPYSGSIAPSLNSGTGLKPGYVTNIEVGYCFGSGDFEQSRFKFNLIAGYQLNPNFSFGFGTGLRAYSDIETLLMPVFAQVKGTLFDNKISPYGALDIGYSLDLTSNDAGGFYLSPTFGAIFQVSNNLWFNIGLGYEMQNMTVYYINSYSNIYDDVENLGAISLNIGLVF